MATQADFGWELPDLSDIADGPDAFLQFADDIAATVKDRGLISYTPSWTSSGPSQPSNTASRLGNYRIDNGICNFVAYLQFSGSTNGGIGELSIGLPVPATSAYVQQVAGMLWTPNATALWCGPGMIDGLTNWQRVRPFFPVNNTRPDLLPWASTGGFLGLSVPSVLGGTPVIAGGFIQLQGSYFIA